MHGMTIIRIKKKGPEKHLVRLPQDDRFLLQGIKSKVDIFEKGLKKGGRFSSKEGVLFEDESNRCTPKEPSKADK